MAFGAVAHGTTGYSSFPPTSAGNLWDVAARFRGVVYSLTYAEKSVLAECGPHVVGSPALGR
jgi:hypothetical protein